jgi:hypothetical protein
VPGTCASECIVSWRIQKQHRYCDESEKKGENGAYPSCFMAPIRIAPIRSTDIVLRVKHPNTSRFNAENGLPPSRDRACRRPCGEIAFASRLEHLRSTPYPVDY